MLARCTAVKIKDTHLLACVSVHLPLASLYCLLGLPDPSLHVVLPGARRTQLIVFLLTKLQLFSIFSSWDFPIPLSPFYLTLCFLKLKSFKILQSHIYMQLVIFLLPRANHSHRVHSLLALFCGSLIYKSLGGGQLVVASIQEKKPLHKVRSFERGFAQHTVAGKGIPAGGVETCKNTEKWTSLFPQRRTTRSSQSPQCEVHKTSMSRLSPTVGVGAWAWKREGFVTGSGGSGEAH